MPNRVLSCQLLIQWDGIEFIDESEQLISLSGSSSLGGELPWYLGGNAASDCSIVLRNIDHRYSTWNTSSELYDYISNGRIYRVKLQVLVSVNGGVSTTPIFTGYIENYKDDPVKKEIELSAMDLSSILRGQLVSTYVYEDGILYHCYNNETDSNGLVIQETRKYTGRVDEYIERMASLIRLPYRAEYSLNDDGIPILPVNCDFFYRGIGEWVLDTVTGTSKWIGEAPRLDTDDKVEVLILDKGTTKISYAWADEESIWDEMTLAAEVECGRVYVNPSGQIVFENGSADALRQQLVNSSPIYTINSFLEIGEQYDLSNVYNEIVVEYTPFAFGGRDIVYEQSDTEMNDLWLIPPNDRALFEIVFSSPVRALCLYQPRYDADNYDRCDYLATTAGGVDITTSVDVSFEESDAARISAQSAKIAVINHSNYTAYLNKFQLQGVPLIGSPSRKTKSIVSQSDPALMHYGKRRYDAPTNHYVQTESTAQYISDALLTRCKTPMRVFSMRIPGDPALWLCDIVRISDTVSTVPCMITGVNWSYSGQGGYVMDLSLVDITGVLAEMSPVYIVGHSYLGASTPVEGHTVGKAWW